jgi:hypothetical protein
MADDGVRLFSREFELVALADIEAREIELVLPVNGMECRPEGLEHAIARSQLWATSHLTTCRD